MTRMRHIGLFVAACFVSVTLLACNAPPKPAIPSADPAPTAAAEFRLPDDLLVALDVAAVLAVGRPA